MLAAPGSNDFGGLRQVDQSVNPSKSEQSQALSEADAKDLCERYRRCSLQALRATTAVRALILWILRAVGITGLALA